MVFAIIFIGVFGLLYVIVVNWRMVILAATHPSMLVQFLAICFIGLSLKGCAELWIWAAA